MFKISSSPLRNIRQSLTLQGIILLSFLFACKEDESLPPLQIFSIQPAVAQIGDTIQIIGQGFSPGFAYNDIIFEGGASTDAMPGSSTEMLWVEVPDGALPGAMTVSILEVETAATPTIEVLIPVISSVTPVEAWIGDTVTITGQYFQTNKQRNHVKMGRGEATTVVASETQLKVIVPQDAEHGPVSVLGFEGPSFRVKPSVIDAIIPLQGVVGDTIEITGKGLNANRVFFTPSVLGTLVAEGKTSRNLRVVVPAGAADGTLKVTNRISNADIVFETTQSFQVYPSIKEISPLSGYVGTPVTIEGYNFSTTAAENIVTFNGITATVTQATREELVATAPPGFSTGPITVTVNGRVAEGPVFNVAEPGAPIVYAVTPRSGAAGSRVMITGINFGTTPASNTVRFSGDAAATVISASATQLVVEVPAQAQSGQILVVHDGKTGIGPSFTIASTPIPFITSIEPASALRGENITINGGNFNASAPDLTISVVNAIFDIVSVTPTQIVGKVPANIMLGDYSLYIVQGGKASNPLSFQVAGNPTIESLNIAEGAPGMTLRITGTEFNPNETRNTVKFGTQTATWVNLGEPDANVIEVYVPDIAPGPYDVTVTAFGKTSNIKPFTIKGKRVAVRNIVYTENLPQGFAIKRRISDPPSETTLFTRYSISPSNVVNVDKGRNQVYFVEEDWYNISRVNMDQSGYQNVYPYASPDYGYVVDMSLDTDHQKIFFSDSYGALFVGSYDGTATPTALFRNGEDDVFPVGLSYAPEDNSLYIISDGYGVTSPSIQRGDVDGNQLNVLFDQASGLTQPYDIKIDFTAQKLFVLDAPASIRVGNLDGTGSLSTLITRSRPIIGMALDTQDQFVYWMEFSDAANTKASVFRMKYDNSTIPGTDPPATTEEVYTNIDALSSDPTNGTTMAGLALEDESGKGGSMRGFSSFSGMKMKRIMNFKPNARKKARPGQ